MSTTTSASGDRTWYRISPIDDTGVFLGLSMAQLIIGCAAALTGALLMVFVSVPFGCVVVGACGGLALARHSGEPVLHQLPTMARLAKRGNKARVWFEPTPLLGPATNKKKLPIALARQELLTVDPARYGVDIVGLVAIVREKKAGIYAITLRIAGRQFGLSEPHAQDFQLAQWGRILQGFVSEHPSISSVRWSEWASPSGVEEQREWLDRNLAAQYLPDVFVSINRSLPISTPLQPDTKCSSRSQLIRPGCGCRNAIARTVTWRSSNRCSPTPTSMRRNGGTKPPRVSNAGGTAKASPPTMAHSKATPHFAEQPVLPKTTGTK